mmetsp:Transcript_1292/g.2185  ORF Transcript_1292/g.2185 Transcript_1292/m.2185 type:complete len:91 (+) Transcript_1292:174-446(+)
MESHRKRLRKAFPALDSAGPTPPLALSFFPSLLLHEAAAMAAGVWLSSKILVDLVTVGPLELPDCWECGERNDDEDGDEEDEDGTIVGRC